MRPHKLADYIRSMPRTERIYRPLMLICLLQKQGWAAKDDIIDVFYAHPKNTVHDKRKLRRALDGKNGGRQSGPGSIFDRDGIATEKIIGGVSGYVLRDYRCYSVPDIDFIVSLCQTFIENVLPVVGKKHAQKNANQSSSAEVHKSVSENAELRSRVVRSVLGRRGQSKFRANLLATYGACCAITGCRLTEILEAAHIKTQSGGDDHRPENGILLRADIHTLFDLHLLAINPVTLCIELDPIVCHDSVYKHLDGKRAKFPNGIQPAKENLAERYQMFSNRT